MQKLTNIINWSVETSETVEKLFKNKATENSDFKTSLTFFMSNNATFTYIFRTYKPITTYDQRCQYKRDFECKTRNKLNSRKTLMHSQ